MVKKKGDVALDFQYSGANQTQPVLLISHPINFFCFPVESVGS
jgi:hypothetical protein